MHFKKYIFSIFNSLLFCASGSFAQTSDTLKANADNSSFLKSKVVYSAEDSMVFEIAEQKVYLYGNAKVDYEKISLKADHIEFSIKNNLIYAKGRTDSAGRTFGEPEFSEGQKTFTASEMSYNFQTKKGRIREVITKEGEGYLHGQVVKKDSTDKLYIKKGKYTTCNLPHPHFYIGASKLKVIPDDKIVTGPAYLVVEDVPTPLALPFGFFPNKKGHATGLLIPRYGESPGLGFFLQEGGYYVALNDYADLALTADIYSKGSWTLRGNTNYRKRYSFNGNFNLSYASVKQGFVGTESFTDQRNFFVRWNHQQDPKARPGSRFSADVNAGSSNFNRFSSTNSFDYLQNILNSSVNYSKTWKWSNLTTSLRHSQNTRTKDISLSVPEIAYNVNRFYPFKRKESVGSAKFYENIGISYQNQLRNTIATKDTLLFKTPIADQVNNGMIHSIPINTSIKMLKYFTFSPSFNYTEFWYTKITNKDYLNDSLVTDTVSGFKAARDYSLSSSLTTKLYGMYQFKTPVLKAIRHVITPSVTASYNPKRPGEQTTTNSLGQETVYNIYETSIIGRPNTFEAGNVGFNLLNNIEMKVRNRKDTITGIKKIVLFEALNIGSNYNLLADSLNLNNVSVSGRTGNLGKLNIMFNALFDPYYFDTTANRQVNIYLYDKSGSLATLRNFYGTLNFSIKSKNRRGTTGTLSEKTTAADLQQVRQNSFQYVDYTIPWSFNLNYNLQYNKNYNKLRNPNQKEIVQTLGFDGDVSITPKWKVGFRSGYDFVQRDFSYTSVNLYRDLHCWEMRFNWVPFGLRKMYSIDINVKASVLQDLKLSRRRDWYDLK